MNFIKKYLIETKKIAEKIDTKAISKILNRIKKTKNQKGRIFFLGVGGSAANASHAVNDFRKICGIECYCATDNVSELTAITNDDGWEKSFENWLKNNNLTKKDLIFVFSVGGGSEKENISMNIVNAIKYAKKKKLDVISVIGKKGGFADKNSFERVIIPNVNIDRVTPHTEGYQAIVWHLLVSHPSIKQNQTTWEKIEKK